VVQLRNAHRSRVDGISSGVHYTVRETSVAALVVHYDAVTSQLGDRWALAVVVLTTGESGVQPLTLINVAATWNAPECSWAVLVGHQPCYPPAVALQNCFAAHSEGICH